jgi:hypothetical protein
MSVSAKPSLTTRLVDIRLVDETAVEWVCRTPFHQPGG